MASGKVMEPLKNTRLFSGVSKTRGRGFVRTVVDTPRLTPRVTQPARYLDF